jgi:cold shock protein
MRGIPEATVIILMAEERAELEGLARSTKTEHRLRQFFHCCSPLWNEGIIWHSHDRILCSRQKAILLRGGHILDSVWCAGIIEIPKWRQRAMATGTVKWFNPTKVYGFIQPQGGGKDIFVHISAVERAGLSTLNEGQQVQYEEVANKGKTSAENLKVK